MISVNVHGIRSYTKRQKVFNWLTRKNADIILLQETYSTKEVERYWKQQWKGKMVFSHGTNHSKVLLYCLMRSLILKLSIA